MMGDYGLLRVQSGGWVSAFLFRGGFFWGMFLHLFLMYENKSFFMIPNLMIILVPNLLLRSSPESS